MMKHATQSIAKMNAANDTIFAVDIVSSEFDLIFRINDAGCVNHRDAYYGHPNNITKPGRSTKMADG